MRSLLLTLAVAAACEDQGRHQSPVEQAEQCDCLGTDSCETLQQLTVRLCDAGLEAVTLETFADCGLVGVGEAAHHWGSTHWFSEASRLVGYEGGDGYVGFSERCGARPPDTCGERARCTLCLQEELRWTPPPACEPDALDSGTL